MGHKHFNKILTDVDGVLLNWEDAFTSWMAKREYTPKVENQYSQNIRYDISKEESESDLVETTRAADAESVRLGD